MHECVWERVSVLKREAENTAIVGISLAALLAALSAPTYLTVAIWVVAYGTVLVRCKELVHGKRLAAQLISRTVLTVTSAAIVLERGGDAVWLVAVAALVVALTIRNETIAKRAYSYAGVRASGLPVLRHRLPNRRLLEAYGVSALACPVVLMVMALTGVPAAWWLLPAAVLLVLSGAICADAFVRRIYSRHAYERIPEALNQLSPAFVVYWDAPRDSQFQIGMWIPHLKKAGVPFFVLVRNAASFQQAVDVADGAPVIFCRTMGDVERCKVASLRAALYVNNAARNSHFVRYGDLTHVQLLHGDSDKAPSFNPVTAMFDQIFVAGQAGVDRYADNGVVVAAEKFRIVGRPQVAAIEPPRSAEPFAGGGTVLYAPTWRGYHEDAAHSSLRSAEAMLEVLLDRGLTVIFRPHPYCAKDDDFRRIMKRLRATLKADAKESGREHVFGAAAERVALAECFNASDAMLADVSSVVPDYLYSTKPFILVDPDGSTDSFVRRFPLAAAAYIIDGSADALRSSLDAVAGPDPMRALRYSKRSHYLGDFPAPEYEDVFISAVRDVSSGPDQVVSDCVCGAASVEAVSSRAEQGAPAVRAVTRVDHVAAGRAVHTAAG